ncbi:MAG: pilus assembly protein PilP [Deltaproteobacteria bacterium]|nr:pilus assembly protein PilP [Deltaproteobacteria bacterium]
MLDVRFIVATNKDLEKNTLEKLRALMEAKKNGYVFKLEGIADPFRPIPAVMAAKAAETKEPPVEELTPLQKMELSQVKLVAVVTSSTGGPTRALVEDSTGMGYIVQLGTPIGRRNGKISGIFTDRVEVQESFKNYLGEEKTNLAVLKLYPMEDEQKRPGGSKGIMKVHPKADP